MPSTLARCLRPYQVRINSPACEGHFLLGYQVTMLSPARDRLLPAWQECQAPGLTGICHTSVMLPSHIFTYNMQLC